MTRVTLSPARASALGVWMRCMIHGGEIVVQPEDSGAVNVFILHQGMRERERWF